MKVTASPRARFGLANLLLNDKLKFKTRKQDAELRRARLALGLMDVTETLLKHRRVNAEYASDGKTLHRFDVPDSTAEFILDCRDKVELNGLDSLVISELVEQLDSTIGAGDATEAFSENLELGKWEPSNLPVFDLPVTFYDVLKTTLESANGFGVWAALMLDELNPAPAENAAEVTK